MRILDGLVIATFAAAGLVSIGLTRWGKSAEPQMAAGNPPSREEIQAALQNVVATAKAKVDAQFAREQAAASPDVSTAVDATAAAARH